MVKTVDERIEELQKKMADLQKKQKSIRAKKMWAERKAHTKLLIELGKFIEGVIGAPIEKENLPKLKNYLEQVAEDLRQALMEDSELEPEKPQKTRKPRKKANSKAKAEDVSELSENDTDVPEQ